VPPEQTFAALAGVLSAKTGPAVQTLNFGVDGYNALQIRELLTARVLAFQPDEVVYMLCLNDFDFTDSSGRKTSYFRKPRFFLPLTLERRYRALRGIEFHHFHYEQHRTEVFDAIAAMATTAQASRARFLLAILPVFPEMAGDPAYFAQYPLRDIHEGIRRFAGSRGMRVHDLLDDFVRQPPPPERYALDLWHLNAEGHRVVAEALAPELGSRP
jgi:lysophospholipase L1-like esterase